MNRKRTVLAAATVALGALLLAGCTSDADTADYNTKQAAEAFEVQREFIGINGITGDTIFYAEGRCSFEYPEPRRFDLMCKYGSSEYRKHVFIMGDQDSVTITQTQDIDVSEYHTRVIIKPQNLIPEFDIMVGEDE